MSEFLGDAAFQDLRDRMAATIASLDSFKVGSLFSGWGIAEMVLHHLEGLWNERNSSTFQMQARDNSEGACGISFWSRQVDVKFMCELDPKKQSYLQKRFPKTRIFCDAADLGNNFAQTAEGGYIPVPTDSQFEFVSLQFEV